jgi:hypothetical protein
MILNFQKIVAAIAFGCALAGVAPGQAKAVQIALNNNLYDVTTLNGTYDASNTSFLLSQPWWGSAGLAASAADQVNSLLGTQVDPIYSSIGPVFVYQSPSSNFYNLYAWNFGIGQVSNALGTPLPATTYTVAVATAIPSVPPTDIPSVPEPFSIIGTLIGGTAAFRMKKKLKAYSN